MLDNLKCVGIVYGVHWDGSSRMGRWDLTVTRNDVDYA
jgi:hypothetical protein